MLPLAGLRFLLAVSQRNQFLAIWTSPEGYAQLGRFLSREKKHEREEERERGNMNERERDQSLYTIISEVPPITFTSLFIACELLGPAHTQREGIKERDLHSA